MCVEHDCVIKTRNLDPDSCSLCSITNGCGKAAIAEVFSTPLLPATYSRSRYTREMHDSHLSRRFYGRTPKVVDVEVNIVQNPSMVGIVDPVDHLPEVFEIC